MEHERIIHILEYLRRNTDETRTVSIKQIQSHLDRNYNMQSVSPLTIRRDIERLTTMGYPITIKRGAHNTYLYQMETEGFTFNEIRFLVDSVSIFLSTRSSTSSRNLNGSVRNRMFESSSAGFKPMI